MDRESKGCCVSIFPYFYIFGAKTGKRHFLFMILINIQHVNQNQTNFCGSVIQKIKGFYSRHRTLSKSVSLNHKVNE